MFKSYVVRIYPSIVQMDFFQRQFGCCRKVFNTFLSRKKRIYELNGEYLSYNECSHELTLMKKQNSWLREVDSQALIQSLRNLETAYKRFFKKISEFPRFKSKYNPVQSYKTMNINNERLNKKEQQNDFLNLLKGAMHCQLSFGSYCLTSS